MKQTTPTPSMSATDALEVHTSSPALREGWEKLLENDAHALVSQTPAWLDCICATGDYVDASRLYETADGRQLVLPTVRRIAQELGEACRIWTATLNGEPVAAAIVLQGRNAHYTRGVMNKDLAAPTQAKYLQQELAMEDACRAGCRYCHMRESGTSTALADFKGRFGAVAHPYAEYRVERLPLTRLDSGLRGFVKRLIGFQDA